jgi:hypothetical protein
MINVDVLAEPSTQHRLKIGFRLCLENRHIQPNLPDDDQEIMRDLKLKEEIVKAGIKLFKARSELEKDSPQIDHIRKLYPEIDDQAARDIRLIAQAVHWAFGKNDLLAVEFVRHFLDRNEKRRGRTVKIRMADLLSQDIGARSRIFQAIRNRMAADRAFQGSWKYLPGIFGAANNKHSFDPNRRRFSILAKYELSSVAPLGTVRR